jgi:hypothetical protein
VRKRVHAARRYPWEESTGAGRVDARRSVILAEVGQPAGRVWWLQSERPVGTVSVAMLDVDPQDLIKVAAADDR